MRKLEFEAAFARPRMVATMRRREGRT